MKRLLLARHGESRNNRRAIIDTDPDRSSPLTLRGRRQARLLGRALEPETIELCATSSLRRARQTATIALRRRGIPILPLREFNEPRGGTFEGGSNDAYEGWIAEAGIHASGPGAAEAQVAALRRYIAGFEMLLSRSEGTILLVAHSLPLMWILAAHRNRADLQVDFANPGIGNSSLHELGAAEARAAVASLRRFIAAGARLGDRD